MFELATETVVKLNNNGKKRNKEMVKLLRLLITTLRRMITY